MKSTSYTYKVDLLNYCFQANIRALFLLFNDDAAQVKDLDFWLKYCNVGLKTSEENLTLT